MNPKNYDLQGHDAQMDAAFKTVVGSGRTTQASAAMPSLNLNPLRSVSKQIQQISDDEYKVVLGRGNLTAASAARKLNASNTDIYDVVYSEDMEDNDLINISGKPLWAVTQKGNSLQIKRVK